MSIQLVRVALAPPIVTLETRGLRDHGHPELRLDVREDVVPAPLVHWLADVLAAPVLAGDRWTDGETVRLGWTSLRTRADGDVLVVDEWDWPTSAWNQGVTRLLHVTGRMNALLDRTNLLDEGTYVSGDDVAVWAAGEGAGAVDLVGERTPSGWRFDAADPAEASAPVELPLWEVVRRRGAVLDALSVPIGSRIAVTGGVVTQVFYIVARMPSIDRSTS